MIWLGWRQQRTEALIVALFVTALAALLIPTGIHVANVYDETGIAACVGDPSERCNETLRVFQDRFNSLTGLFNWLQLVPGMLGALLAAPLVLELEQRTYRLAWTQSISRRRWLLVKLALVGASAIAAAALLTVLLTWWRQPIDDIQGRFEQNSFAFEGIVPYAYMLFAAGLALVAGAVLQRSAPAFAVTLIGFFAVRYVVTSWVRPHLMEPVVKTWKGAPAIGSLHDAWVLSGPELVDRHGNRPSRELVAQCVGPAPGHGIKPLGDACLAKLGILARAEYQPAGRFWTFQWIEVGIYVGAAAALTAFAAWWILKRVS